MSDLYLVLRERIHAVAEGIEIPTEVLQQAQDAKGLSNERLARLLPISERQWRRWKKDGRVPVYWLDRISEVLDLEIERPSFPRSLTVPATPDADERLARMEKLMAQLLDEVGKLREEQDSRPEEGRRARPARR